MTTEQQAAPRIVEVVKVADYWRVLINRKLVSSHRTKADALKSLPKVKKA